MNPDSIQSILFQHIRSFPSNHTLIYHRNKNLYRCKTNICSFLPLCGRIILFLAIKKPQDSFSFILWIIGTVPQDRPSINLANPQKSWEASITRTGLLSFFSEFINTEQFRLTNMFINTTILLNPNIIGGFQILFIAAICVHNKNGSLLQIMGCILSNSTT